MFTCLLAHLVSTQTSYIVVWIKTKTRTYGEKKRSDCHIRGICLAPPGADYQIWVEQHR